jgi:hypothetical protein
MEQYKQLILNVIPEVNLRYIQLEVVFCGHSTP